MPAAKRAKTPKRARDRKPVNLVQIACYVTPEQRDALRELSKRTRITQQVHLREAIDDVLAKYRHVK